MTSKTIAAIDLGSNSFRLLIKKYQKSKGHLQSSTITDDLLTVRLGENLHKSCQLSANASNRGYAACRFIAQRLRQYSPELTRICATEALRKAVNRADFITKAQKILGANIEILSTIQEANLTLQGCLADSKQENIPPTLIVDSGGGSTELILAGQEILTQIHSLPVGAINLTETFLNEQPESDTDLARLDLHLQEILAPVLRSLTQGQTASVKGLALIAAGGTATTLAALDLNIAYQAPLIQGHTVTKETVQTTINRISELNLADRSSLPGLKNRGQIFIAGLKIYETVMTISAINQMTITTFGLLEGILSGLAQGLR